MPIIPARESEVATPRGSQRAGTALALDIPRGPDLPFAKGAAPAPELAASKPAEAKRARAPAELGGTALALDVPRGPDLPFARDAVPGVPLRKHKLAQLSFALNVPRELVRPPAVPTSPASPSSAPPLLTLEQHASLSAELALTHDHAMEVIARYQLTLETKLLVDNHYRAKVAASAEVRASWDRAYRTYYEWLVLTARGTPRG